MRLDEREMTERKTVTLVDNVTGSRTDVLTAINQTVVEMFHTKVKDVNLMMAQEKKKSEDHQTQQDQSC